jgi:hypothetical protein
VPNAASSRGHFPRGTFKLASKNFTAALPIVS